MSTFRIALAGLDAWESNFVAATIEIAAGTDIAAWRQVGAAEDPDLLLVHPRAAGGVPTLQQAHVDHGDDATARVGPKPRVVLCVDRDVRAQFTHGRLLDRPITYSGLIALLREVEAELRAAACAPATAVRVPAQVITTAPAVVAAPSPASIPEPAPAASPASMPAAMPDTLPATSPTSRPSSSHAPVEPVPQAALPPPPRRVEFQPPAQAPAPPSDGSAPSHPPPPGPRKTSIIGRPLRQRFAPPASSPSAGVPATSRSEAPTGLAAMLARRTRPSRRFRENTRLLGLVQYASLRRGITEITHPGFPPLMIIPAEHAYVCPVDPASVGGLFRTPAWAFTTRELDPVIAAHALADAQREPLWRLLYCAALFGSEARLLADVGPDDRLRLLAMPDFEAVPHVAAHRKVAAYMLAHIDTLVGIARATGASLETVIGFCNACEQVGLVERNGEPAAHADPADTLARRRLARVVPGRIAGPRAGGMRGLALALRRFKGLFR